MFSPLKADVSIKGTEKLRAVCWPFYPTKVGTYNSVIDQINFIGHKEDLDIVRSKILNLVHPLVDRLKTVLIINTIYDDNSVSALLQHL